MQQSFDFVKIKYLSAESFTARFFSQSGGEALFMGNGKSVKVEVALINLEINFK